MKKVVSILVLVICVFSAFAGGEPNPQSSETVKPMAIRWEPFEEAVAQAAIDEKPILLDVYTVWCGWCKRMDATTYADSAIIAYINEHFHPVKLDAESKTAHYKYHDKMYNPTDKTHELAIELLQGKMSYPTTVFIDEQLNIVAPVPGYLTPTTVKPYLLYFGEKIYKLTNSWEIFNRGLNAPEF